MTISKIAFVDKTLSDYSFDISYEQGIFTMMITFVFFTILALYLDEVIPNELGTHKHPLFFLNIGYN